MHEKGEKMKIPLIHLFLFAGIRSDADCQTAPTESRFVNRGYLVGTSGPIQQFLCESSRFAGIALKQRGCVSVFIIFRRGLKCDENKASGIAPAFFECRPF